MTAKTYTPKPGSTPARVIEHLQKHGGSMDRQQIADLLGIPANNVQANMATAVHHGVLIRERGHWALPMGTTSQPAADLQAAWGGGTRPAFPAAPPRAADPEPKPRKMRTLKQVSQEFHRERNRPAKPGTALAAVPKSAPAPAGSAVAHVEPIDLQPASLRQVGGTHYKQMAVQPWDVVDGWPLELRIGYYRGNALKYLMRMGTKDEELQEILKCQHYVAKLVETLRERDAQVAA